MRTRTLLAAAAIVAGTFGSASANPSPADRVIENTEITITEPIVVAPGATLTIRNATVWLDMQDICPTRGSIGYCQPHIMALGTLVVEDSVIDSRLWSSAEPDTGYQINVIGGTARITGSTFRHFRNIGAQNDARMEIADSTFVDGVQGPNFFRGATGTVRTSTFDTMLFGVATRDTTARIIGNTFRNIVRAYTGNPFGRAIDIQGTLVGEKAWTNTSVVEGNLIEDSYQGLLSLTPDRPQVHGNTFRRNIIGASIGLTTDSAVLGRGTPEFETNRFEGNVDAVQIYMSGTPATDETITVSLRRNAFTGTECTDVGVLRVAEGVRLTVDARQNWWGSAAGPQDRDVCPAVSGPVDVEPWLTEAP